MPGPGAAAAAAFGPCHAHPAYLSSVAPEARAELVQAPGPARAGRRGERGGQRRTVPRTTVDAALDGTGLWPGASLEVLEAVMLSVTWKRRQAGGEAPHQTNVSVAAT